LASFCTKCGSPLTSNTGFCTTCGAPVPASNPPAQGVTPVPYTPPAQPAYTQPPAYSQPQAYPPAPQYPSAQSYPPAGKSSGGGATKIIMIVIAVIVVLILLAGAVGTYFWYQVKKAVTVNEKGDGVSLSVPGGGNFSVGESANSAADLGVPVYPGAVKGKGSVNMKFGGTSMVIGQYTTSDSIDQVVDFYKSKLPSGSLAVTSGTNDGIVLNSGGPETDRIVITVDKGIGNDEGRTSIGIVHSKKGA
jgi:hypothetical protein